MSDSLAIADQLYTFANNPATRPICLHEDTVRNSIVALLSDTDPAVVSKVLETIFVLASDSSTSAQTAKLPNLFTTLASLADYELECPEQATIRHLSQQNMQYLSKATARSNAAAAAAPGASSAVGERTCIPEPKTQNARAFGSKYNHQVSFSIPTLKSEEDKSVVEDILIHVKGTLAVTVDFGNKTANCFTSLEIAQYSVDACDQLDAAGYPDVCVLENTKKGKRAQGSDALVTYVAKSKRKQNQEQQAGWLGGITSYFW